MKNFFNYFEKAMAASAFAEEGEFETARAIMNEKRPRKTDRPQAYDDKRTAARNQMRAD